MKGKKFVHIIHSGTGGTGSLFFAIAEADLNNTHIAIAWGTEPVQNYIEQRANEQDLPLYYISKKQGVDISAWRKMSALISDLRPEVVFLHSLTALPAVWLARTQTQNRYNFQLCGIEHTYFACQSFQEKCMLQILARMADRMICFSQAQADSLKKRTGRKQVDVIPHQINTRIWFPEKVEDKNRDVFILASHGRFTDWKRISLLVDILHALQDSTFQLELMGDGPDIYSFQKKIREYGLENQVKILNPSTASEIRIWLSHADLWLCFSKGETTGLSALEAILCEIPVMLSGHPALSDWVKNEDHLEVNILAQKIRDIRSGKQKFDTAALRNKIINTWSERDWLKAWLGA